MARTTSRVRAARGVWAAYRAATRPGSASLQDRVLAVPRLVRAVLLGRYTGTSARTLVLSALGLVYVVSPVDLMPEGLFAALGLADDALVMAWVVSTLVNATEAYLQWESGSTSASDDPGTVPSRVVR